MVCWVIPARAQDRSGLARVPGRVVMDGIATLRAATWTFEGQPINDWRMTDVETGEPSYLPFYVAEEFCINNPDAGARSVSCKAAFG